MTVPSSGELSWGKIAKERLQGAYQPFTTPPAGTGPAPGKKVAALALGARDRGSVVIVVLRRRPCPLGPCSEVGAA